MRDEIYQIPRRDETKAVMANRLDSLGERMRRTVLKNTTSMIALESSVEARRVVELCFHLEECELG